MSTIYDTNVLVAVVQNLMTPQSFLLDKFFPRVVESTTEQIAIDVVIGQRRISPFVSPLSAGKVVSSLARRTDSFAPAYVKDKRRLDPKAPLVRAVGERIGGDLTPQQREQANLDFQLQDQLSMLTRREELMAADALLDGKTTVEGDEYPAVEVDFQRDTSLNVGLTGADRWGLTDVYPTEDVSDWAELILKSSGLVPTDIVFTSTPWKKFKNDPHFKEDVKIDNRGTTSSVDTAAKPIAGAMYKGKWGGFDLWLYNDWYIDPADGQLKPVIPDNRVIMGSPAVDGVRNYGLIQDPKANYQPSRYFPKSWIDEDPAQRWLMLQSAPLPVPTNVNATLCANIDAGG